MRTDTPTLITAMRVLAVEIQSGDGVANSAIAEAAEGSASCWMKYRTRSTN
jgi:hypothetical protein